MPAWIVIIGKTFGNGCDGLIQCRLVFSCCYFICAHTFFLWFIYIARAFQLCLTQEIYKGESSLLLTPVLTLWGDSHIDCQLELSYSAFGFGAIIQRNLLTLSLPHDSWQNNHYACVIYIHAGKATHACLAGLATKKSGGTITHLHTWWQDGCHNRFPLYISLAWREICNYITSIFEEGWS